MVCAHPYRAPLKSGLGFADVPCGKCMPCKIQKVSEWSTRMMFEAETSGSAYMITLTYNNKSRPELNSIWKRDVQLFLKRFRKETGQKVRYFCCGEYGSKTDRPHYHMILFGWKPPVDDLTYLKTTKKGSRLFSSATVARTWTAGFNSLGAVNRHSCRYTAKYLYKDYNNGFIPDGVSSVPLRQNPFLLVSKGLGKDWLYDNQRFVKAQLGLTVNGVRTCLPRYFKRLLQLPVEELLAAKAKREVEVDRRLAKRLPSGLGGNELEAGIVRLRKEALRQGEIDAIKRTQFLSEGDL